MKIARGDMEMLINAMPIKKAVNPMYRFRGELSSVLITKHVLVRNICTCSCVHKFIRITFKHTSKLLVLKA